jgi:hypothetical protein
MNSQELLEAMWKAARTAAGAQVKDLRGYLDKEIAAIAKGAVAIEVDLLSGRIKQSQAKRAWDDLADSAIDIQLAVTVTLQAAAQDAINAALSVASKALSKAIGFAII